MEKGYIYLEKTSCLNLEPSIIIIIKTSCHFSPLLILGIRNYLLMFNFPEQVHQWILNGILKKRMLWYEWGGTWGRSLGEQGGGVRRQEKKGREVGEKFKKASFSYLSLLIISSQRNKLNNVSWLPFNVLPGLKQNFICDKVKKRTFVLGFKKKALLLVQLNRFEIW